MLSGACGAVHRGEEISGAGDGGAVPSEERKEAILDGACGAVPNRRGRKLC